MLQVYHVDYKEHIVPVCLFAKFEKKTQTKTGFAKESNDSFRTLLIIYFESEGYGPCIIKESIRKLVHEQVRSEWSSLAFGAGQESFVKLHLQLSKLRVINQMIQKGVV